MNLYQITNPQTQNSGSSVGACSLAPLCANKVCDKSLPIEDRVAGLISSLTLEEKVSNLVDSAAGSLRLGLMPYEWWSEALHGVAESPGVSFNSPNGSDFSYATSFPMPILMSAAFDDPLINAVASVVGKEARAFANNGHAGFDFWTPNINPFRDPRWGRGLETPGEDAFHVQRYIENLIPGLQGGLDDPSQKQIIATCKHYAVYDIETNRTSNNLDPTQQDLGEYYLAPFKTCVRDVAVGSVMCAYNAVDGIPSCASEYLLQDVLREAWNFSSPYNYVTSDCDAIGNIYNSHHFVDSNDAGAAVALNAGTDLDCGTTYLNLNASVAMNQTTVANVDRALTRLYNALFSIGYFDGNSPFGSLNWSDVSTPASQSLAYEAAVEGMTLLKNDGTLPVSKNVSKVAVIGPWANATTQMQGNYEGVAPYLNSPLEAFQSHWANVQYVNGTGINSTDTSGFAAAVAAAKSADLTIYLGGIDTTIEAEGMDRTSIVWPGNQLDLIGQLANSSKALVVVQFGGGQVDDTAILSNKQVNSLVWGGYPGQDGGYAILDVLTGTKSIAGRLPVTQYPANYTSAVTKYEMDLRPNSSYPGRTYKWYTGTPIIPFGYGLHYTNFSFSWSSTPQPSYDISSLISASTTTYKDTAPFTTVTASITNAGGLANLGSDYVALLFLSTSNAGPAPYPNKSLVSYARAHDIAVGSSQTVNLPLTLGSLARADENGDLVLYPGEYVLELDVDAKLRVEFALTGSAAVVDALPRRAGSYNFTVPVYPQGPTSG
ncbi:glycoside hydrolase family 3 protein [Viridothelium virens]|uniref:xylan 1,4-beta-xylosidase n=1 Tax=Viridothelium virens TaxID=1048519 RepID=A0A6A6GXW9_VIRVR|nr:glycoside hydrolase family 3 protein [Viridothelium virens]